MKISLETVIKFYFIKIPLLIYKARDERTRHSKVAVCRYIFAIYSFLQF